ncbi:MAG: N-acetylmuramoyl-L-alanine amidase [Paracoccaceae bacterium]
MIRILIALLLSTQMAAAQNFSALARVDPSRSAIKSDGETLVIDLGLSQPVPWRIYTLADPMRLVLDFDQVDWSALDTDTINQTEQVTGLRAGQGGDGWSRLVMPLAAPLGVSRAGMRIDDVTGAATLVVSAAPVSAELFAATARAEPGLPARPAVPSAPKEDGPLVVVIDPGHGGIDPGALRDDVVEAELMLQLAREVAEGLNRAGGIRAVLTRDEDIFVPLAARMTIARAAGADLLISLHADALEKDLAQGASVYTLTEEASDGSAQRMAERHGREDLVSGLDLTGQDDRVATVLMELARAETAPASNRFATALVTGMREAGVRLNSRPRREGPLAVLNATDFPSVLLEAGFLSSSEDRSTLRSPAGRAAFVRGITDAVLTWAVEEEMLAPLKRN